MRELSGKVAVVTGAASGIGRALAGRFASEGMNVVLADVERAALDTAASASSPRRTAPIACSPCRPTCRTAPRSTPCAMRRSPGSAPCTSCATTPASAAPAAPCGRSPRMTGAGSSASTSGASSTASGHSGPGLVEQGEGHIVNTASIAGVITSPLLGSYCVTKHGVVALSESLAADLAHGRQRRRCLGAVPRVGAHATSPSPIATDRTTWPATGRPARRRRGDRLPPPDPRHRHGPQTRWPATSSTPCTRTGSTCSPTPRCSRRPSPLRRPAGGRWPATARLPGLGPTRHRSRSAARGRRGAAGRGRSARWVRR